MRRASLLAVVALGCAGSWAATGSPAREGRGPSAGRAGLGANTIDRIEIYKENHRLEAWSGERLVKTYTVAVGFGGAGAKRVEGDRRTPEGTYRVDDRHPSTSFHRFLRVSYPNARDREAFRRGQASGEIAPGVRIGGAIGIHGEKRGYVGLPHKWFDWTAGCIALDNAEIEELYEAVRANAVVVIHP